MIDGQLMGPFAQSEQLRPVGHCSHVVILVKIYCLHVANNICAATPWSYHLTFFYISPLDYHWYITHTNDTEIVEGDIRSVLSGRTLLPELEWEYLTVNITECTTVG